MCPMREDENEFCGGNFDVATFSGRSGSDEPKISADFRLFPLPVIQPTAGLSIGFMSPSRC
jgi:hypothetical protein